VRNAIGVGFLGGFTTLSTLTTQTSYLVVNVAGGLLAATAGYAVGRAVTG
jgi:fluoride ion exporter CrcB/FEX